MSRTAVVDKIRFHRPKSASEQSEQHTNRFYQLATKQSSNLGVSRNPILLSKPIRVGKGLSVFLGLFIEEGSSGIGCKEVERAGGMATKRRRSDDHRRRRLHLVARDWNRGFTLYRLDINDFDLEPDSDNDDMDSKAVQLPSRPLVRLVGGSTQQFVAAGKRIFDFYRLSNDRSNLVFDTNTLGVTAAPAFQAPKSFATFFAVGHTVYALDCGWDAQRRSCFEKLPREPLPCHGEWRWETLPAPPFQPANVTSYALHPDGSTVFLSVWNAGTFSFDTRRRAWRRHGRWDLPFNGEAHFVSKLDAWVGLCSEHDGHIVACQVPSLARHRHRDESEPPTCKSGKDTLYCNKTERHLDASLAYRGDAHFCLQEVITRKGYNFNMSFGVNLPMLLRLLTFRVKYSGDGELCVVNRRSRIYKLSRDSAEHTPVAFWM